MKSSYSLSPGIGDYPVDPGPLAAPPARITIAVAGNIGSGKTTLAQRISEVLHFEAFLEPVAANPYLEDFYLNPARWSFPLQVVFFTQKLRLLQRLQQSPHHRVLDRTLQEDAEVFAATQHQAGFMDERDWQAYRELYRAIEPSIVLPDLILYLQADVDFLMYRIQRRSRQEEKPISEEYLGQLNEAYDRWIEEISRRRRVLKIRALDYESGPDWKRLDALVHDIERLLARTIAFRFQR